MRTKNIDIIRQSPNGKVFKCPSCDKLHIEYKNLSFAFSDNEFNDFRDYFLRLQPEKWEYLNKDSCMGRKIMIPIGHRNVTSIFHVHEIYELKSLLGGVKKRHHPFEFIKLAHVEAPLSLN
jgi:hypothetical protein